MIGSSSVPLRGNEYWTAVIGDRNRVEDRVIVTAIQKQLDNNGLLY